MKKRGESEKKVFPFETYFSETKGREPLIFFPISLDFSLNLVAGAVFMDEERLYRMVQGSEGVVERAYPLSDIREARFVSFAGLCACEILVGEAWLEFCRSRGKDRGNVSQLVRILNEIASGAVRPEEARFVKKETVCPRCHRPYARGSQTCAHCDGRKSSVRRLYGFAKPYRLLIFISVFLFGVTAALELVVPYIQKILVDDYVRSPDPASILANFGSLVLVILSMAGVRILIVCASVLRNDLLDVAATRVTVTMRKQLYTHIQSLSVAGISRHTAGDLISRVSGDISTISDFLSRNFPTLAEQLLKFVFVGAVLFARDPRLALFVLLPVPFVVGYFRLVWRYTHKLYHRQWMEQANAHTVLHDIFQGVRVVKVYGTEKSEIEKFDRVIRKVRDISYHNEKVWSCVMPYATFFLQIGNFIMLYYVGNRVLGNEMTLGDLTMFSTYVSLLYAPLRWMAHLPRILQHVATSLTKVYEILDEAPDVADAAGAREIPLRGEIEVDRVTFGYDENENVLENVSVKVHPGEMLGIVGRSGVGKSTLVNLIMRLYDVEKGEIRIDGVNVKDISQHSLRSQIGVVLQETFLFAGTVYDNLAYAKPDATREEIILAAKFAGAHEFILALPDGYQTLIGERGYTLSGGERQRIAIARAVLHDPKILILDEATSSLDTETEKKVQDALARLCRDRTTLAIAHRLSTLRNATKILVLDKKTVAEVGTHEELLQKKGIYYELVMAQRQMSSLKKKKTPLQNGENTI